MNQFLHQRDEFIAAGGGKRFEIGYDFPCLDDDKKRIPFEPHYFYHPAWAARILRETAPARHVDISSSFVFVGWVSAICPTEYYEYQPPEVKLDGLTVGRADLCALPFADHSIHSLSSMHVVEHVGLGRYGDKPDPDGDIKAAEEIERVLAAGAHFLFVAPMAERSRIEFNAHRIYSHQAILDLFPNLEVVEFSLVLDNHRDGLIRYADPARLHGQVFACGCFHFRSPGPK